MLGLLIDFEAFEVEFVVFDSLGMEGLEGSEADVEGDFGAIGLAPLEDFFGEVEASGGGGDAAAFTGVDGLVALGVGFVIGAANVGRERDVAVGLDGVPLVFGVEADAAFAVFETLLDDGVEAFGEFDLGTWGKFAAGADQCAPSVAELFGEEDFDAAGVAGAMADESGFEDAGVVEDEQIGWLEECGEVFKRAVFPGFGLAVEDQHAGTVALFRGLLGDQLFGEVIIELR